MNEEKHFLAAKDVSSGKKSFGRVLSTKQEGITAKQSKMELWEKTETAI